jgi:hypothetical protein
MKIGDRVKVKEQDIYGRVVAFYIKSLVIEDEDSEWEWPENCLEYRIDEVELIEESKDENQN